LPESTRTILLIMLVAFIALAGGRVILRRRGRPPLFRLHTLGYLIVGLVLGEQGLGFLSLGMLANLEPVVGLALGWAGLLFGLQFEFRRLGRFPATWAWAALVQALVTAGSLLVALILSVNVLFAWEGARYWVGLWLLVAAGSASSPSETALAAGSSDRIQRRFAQFAHYMASLDSALPVAILGVLAGWFHAGGGELVPAVEWAVASVLIGLALGFLFYSYARHRHTENELAMMIIAFAVTAAGIAAFLQLSSLFICMVMGAFIGNSLKDTGGKIFRVLAVRERPILVVLLVLVGAGWQPVPAAQTLPVAICLVVFLAARVAAKLVSGALFGRIAGADTQGAGTVGGLALLGQGGMSVALVANCQLLFGGLGLTEAVSVALLGVVAAEAVAAYAARLALVKRGEKGGGP